MYVWGMLPTGSSSTRADSCDTSFGGDGCRTFWNMTMETVGGGAAGYIALHVIAVVLFAITAIAVVEVFRLSSDDDTRSAVYVSVRDDEAFTKGGVIKH